MEENHALVATAKALFPTHFTSRIPHYGAYSLREDYCQDPIGTPPPDSFLLKLQRTAVLLFLNIVFCKRDHGSVVECVSVLHHI